jgi:acyl-CoA reductase-like NAD-dependent aldehyde dehydrogenase
VILKPSEWSLPIGKLIIGLFEQLNLPQGLVVSLVGGREVGEQLIAAVPDYVFLPAA